jgi:hypothetical protein
MSMRAAPSFQFSAASIMLYKISPDGRELEFLHETEMDEPPLALMAFKGRLAVGSGVLSTLQRGPFDIAAANAAHPASGDSYRSRGSLNRTVEALRAHPHHTPNYPTMGRAGYDLSVNKIGYVPEKPAAAQLRTDEQVAAACVSALKTEVDPVRVGCLRRAKTAMYRAADWKGMPLSPVSPHLSARSCHGRNEWLILVVG